MKELEAGYNISSSWDLENLGLDLDKVQDWYVKWNVLNVMRTKDSKWEAFDGNVGEPEYKRPDCLYIDGEETA